MSTGCHSRKMVGTEMQIQDRRIEASFNEAVRWLQKYEIQKL